MRSEWRDGERVRSVEVTPLEPGRFRVVVDGATLELGVERRDDGRLLLSGAGGPHVAEVTSDGARRFVRLDTLEFVLSRESGTRRRGTGAAAGGLDAPMPGVVTRVMVAVGDEVAKGQPLLALEAMKMEHVIRSPRAGRIARLGARAGEMVAGGATLVELEPDASPAS
jgi:biotin carboxyl carrier protein